MAEAWGNQVHHWQAYVEASITSETATQATITCKTYWHSISWGYSYYGHGYGVIGSTTGTDSGQVVFSSGTGASVYQLLTTMTKTISKTGSAQTITCKGVAILTGDSSGTRNGTSTATCTVTVPAIAYEAPNGPTSCSASRSSDTKATVTWVNGDVTTTRPRNNNYIERSTDGGSWTQIASIAGTTSNYTDNGISANHRYAYRVRSGNSAGKSGYATSGYIYTTPAAPASVTVSKTAATTVQVGITGAAPYATGYDVARKDGSADWVRLASNAAMPYTDSSVPAGTVQYAARAVRGSLVSAWTFSESIVTVTAPLAPTITAYPANPSILGWTVPIRWTPNHPDGSAQTSAQVEITRPDGTTSTVTVSGTATETSVELTQAGTWTARVRTHGLYDGWGAWSSTVSWGAYAAPVVTITSPAVDGVEVSLLPITIAWEITDPTGVSSQSVRLYDDDGMIYSVSVPSGTTAVTIGADDAQLSNGTEYRVGVIVTGGSGLSASATRIFVTDWAPPMLPTANVASDSETLGASVTVFAGEATGTLPSGTPATASLMVSRIGADGSRWVVGSGLASGDTVTDPLPPLGVEYAYEVTASAETGATASVTYTEYIRSRAWALNFGAGAGEVLMLYGNPKSSYGLDQSGEAYHFADGGMGGGMPVWYGLTDRDRSGSLSFDVVGPEDADRLEALCDAHPVGWMRDPFGHRRHCVMTPKVSHGVGQVWQLSISWDGVRWEEAW